MSLDKHEMETWIYAKGSELDILAKNLVEFAFDESESTRQALQLSIISLGIHEPKLLLSLILSFLKKSIKNKKVQLGHRIILLNCMKEILKSKDNELKEITDFVTDIIKQVIEEMTSSKEIQPDLQSAASEVLVTLSTKFCHLEMELLLDKLQPSELPHFFIIQTLGAMAAHNPYDMVSYLSSIITQVLTMLSLAKTDNFRWVISSSMSQFSEAILEYVANPDRSPYKHVATTSFSNYIFSAFEVFFSSWLNTKEPKLRKSLLDAIGNMVFIIERNNFEALMGKLISSIISQYKKHPDAYHVTKALSQVLQAATSTYSSATSQAPTNLDSPSSSEMPLIIECLSLNVEMDNIINVLFNQLQLSLEASISTSLTASQQINIVRNLNEVKRCFTTLCMLYPQNIIASCFLRLEGSDKQKISALVVLKHVISSCDKQLHDKHSQIILGLRNLIGDSSSTNNSSYVVPSNAVKLNLAHVIITMGGKGYLSEPGGMNMVEFIVRHCTETKFDQKNKKIKLISNDQQSTTHKQLKALCENILQLSSSTVPHMRPVLWPYLMQLIVPVQYTDAVGTICRAIYNLFSTEISDDSTNTDSTNNQSDYDDIDCMIDYDLQVNILPPQFLLARLIVVAGVPLQNDGRGLHILKAMQVLIYNFHENLPPIWNLVIPKLISYLEKFIYPDFNDNSESDDKKFDKSQWEELLLKLIAKSIEHVNDEEWTVAFGEALGQQIDLYDKLPEEKGFLFKCLGTIMANSNKKIFIDKHLNLMFEATRFLDIDERMGFAVGFGLCAAVHLDTVLSKLEIYYKADVKRSSSIFDFIKDKTEKEVIKASLLLTFGNALFYGPKELVPSRLESYVIKTLQPYLKAHKDQLITRLIVQTIDLIARAVNAENLGQHYRLEMRMGLITCLLNFIDAEPSSNIYSDIRGLAMRTIGNLMILHPPVTNVEMKQVLSSCIDNIFNLPPGGISVKKSKDMSFKDVQILTSLMSKTIESLNNLCKTILKTFFSTMTFIEMFKVVQHRLISEHDHIRERALCILQLILSSYYQELNDVNNSEAFELRKSGTQLSCIGTLLGDITPRLADPDLNNRQLSLECVIIILKIQMKLDLGRDPSTDQLITSLSNVMERLINIDSNLLFAAVNDIAKVVCKKVTIAMLDDLLTSLYNGLKDGQKHGASSVSVMLNVLFRSRYGDLGEQVGPIFTTLHNLLPDLVENPRIGVFRALKLLSSHYLVELLNTAMAQCLPLDEIWKEMLINTINEGSLLDKALVHLMEIMARTMPYEEREDPSSRKVKGQPTKMIRYSCHTWLAAMNCLQILCSNAIECGTACLTRMYSKLFSSILVACASSIICSCFTGKSYEKKSGLEANLAVGIRPISICSDGLRNFLVTTQSHEIIEEINVQYGWDKLENEEEFMNFVTLLTKSICEHKSSEMVYIVSNLGTYSNSNYEQHRILVTGFYGSVISDASLTNADSLIDFVIHLLLSKLGDKSVEVRRLSLVGMGNVGRCNDTIVDKHATSLLSALLIGMDDRHDLEDKLINAAMDGIASLVLKLSEKDVRDVLVTICLRMLSCYERESSNIRASAFRLFGSLAKLATGVSHTRYMGEIDSVLVPLLVHLEDPCLDVIKACKFTLKQIMPLYCSMDLTEHQSNDNNKLNELVQSRLKEDSSLHYGEFCNDFSKTLVSQMPQKVNEIIMRCLVYFKSEYPELASCAVLTIGFMMHNLEEEQKASLQKGQICVELIHLLRSKHDIVRTRTAEAISLLHMY